MIVRLSYENISECYDSAIVSSSQWDRLFSYKLPMVPYGSSKEVVVRLEEQKLIGGQLTWKHFSDRRIALREDRCTADQHEKLMADIVSGLPPSLGGFVRSHAYEHGHSSGYEECLSIAMELAYELQEILPKLKRELAP